MVGRSMSRLTDSTKGAESEHSRWDRDWLVFMVSHGQAEGSDAQTFRLGLDVIQSICPTTRPLLTLSHCYWSGQTKQKKGRRMSWGMWMDRGQPTFCFVESHALVQTESPTSNSFLGGCPCFSALDPFHAKKGQGGTNMTS